MPLLVCFRLSVKEMDRMEISRFEMMQIKTQSCSSCPCPWRYVTGLIFLFHSCGGRAADGPLDEWASDSAEWSIIGKRLDDGEGRSFSTNSSSLPSHPFPVLVSLPPSLTVNSAERTHPQRGKGEGVAVTIRADDWKKQGIKFSHILRIITKMPYFILYGIVLSNLKFGDEGGWFVAP
jgi:hypothetical protein